MITDVDFATFPFKHEEKKRDRGELATYVRCATRQSGRRQCVCHVVIRAALQRGFSSRAVDFSFIYSIPPLGRGSTH